MAVIRRNNVAMISTTGGTGAIVVSTPIDGRATFQQAVGATSGTFQLEYFIEGPGMHEEGLGTFDAATGILTRTSILESWTEAGGFGTAPLSLPTTEVTVRLAPTANRVPSVDAIGTVASANLSGDPATFLNGAGTFSAPPTAGVPDWTDITNKPSTFTPSAHSHSIGDVTDLQGELDSKADVAHDHDIDDLLSGIEGTRAAGKVVGVDGSGDTAWVDPTTAHGIADHTDVDDSGKNTGMAWVVDGEGKTVPAYLTAADISDLEEATNDEVRIAAGTKLRALPFAFTAADFAVPLLEMPTDMYGEVTALILQPRVGSGDVDVTVKVDGTGVTSLVEVAATDSRQAIAATGNEAIAPGDVISIELSDTSGDVFIAGQVMVQIVDEPS